MYALSMGGNWMFLRQTFRGTQAIDLTTTRAIRHPVGEVPRRRRYASDMCV